MPIKSKRSLPLLSLLVVIVVAASILDCAICASDGLVVQNVGISPKVATIGQNVRVTANIRNTGRNKKTCDVKAYVGESVVEEFKEITIAPQDAYSFVFSVNTSSLSEGKYPVGIVVEEAANEQTIFDLGTVTIGQETSEQEGLDQENSAGLNMLFLIPVIPIGAVVSFFVWKRRRSNKEENKMSKDLLPNLLNEVLNFEEKAEGGAAKNSNSSSDKGYVC